MYNSYVDKVKTPVIEHVFKLIYLDGWEKVKK